MHHISATFMSQQRMMYFRFRCTSARGAPKSHLWSLVLPAPFSLLICFHFSFQALANWTTLVHCSPSCSFSRKSVGRFLQFASQVHMVSSCCLSLIPYFCFSRLLHKTSKLFFSFSLYPPLHHKTCCCLTNKQSEKSRRSYAGCLLLARRDHQSNCKLGWKAWHWQPDRLISKGDSRCTTPLAHPPQHHNNYCDCLHVPIKRLVIKHAHLTCCPTNKRAVHFLLGHWWEQGHQQSRQLPIYDAADRPAPQYAEQLKSHSYSFLGLPRFFFSFCGSTAGSWKDVSEAAAGPSRSLCEGLGDEQEEAGSLQCFWDPSLHRNQWTIVWAKT